MRVTNLIKPVIFAAFFIAGIFVAAGNISRTLADAASAQPALVQQTSPAQKRMDGIWVGILEVQGLKLRMILRVTQDAAGALSAKLDVPDQGASDLSIDSISLQGETFRFEAKALGLNYEGTLNPTGEEISGTLKQGPATFPVTFKRTDKVAELNRPQDPKKPYPYLEEDVSYENKIDAVKITGTLTMPRTGGPFPAVLLITGSGSQDRNETVAGHRPFLVLADHLTRLGIAVLRVDDRGMGGTSQGAPNFTTENFVGDVLTGVEYLKTRKEINPRQIGLIGHSEGGMIAPMAAVRSKDISFIVLMAGPGLPGDEEILIQNDMLLKAQGFDEDSLRLAREIFTAIFAVLKSRDTTAVAGKKIQDLVAAKTAAMTETQKKNLDSLLKMIETQRQQIYLLEWFRFFLRFDPRPVLKTIRIPVLAINGEKDLQVAAKANLDAIAASLKEGGNKDYLIVSMPELNHMFQHAKTGLIMEYGEIPETISPEALKTMSDWILKHTTAKK
ncbi:MAG TPA: alpha/beta hydrolase [Pyrinomonadaceae bacterium]|nr:alpha/beta hydrolase [Pyrinomonadaceae bacterium]